jgi:STE24 endopeptidase
MAALLVLFVVLRLAQEAVETALAALNRRYALEPARLTQAAQALRISEGDVAKAVAYSGDVYRFGLVYGWIEVVASLAFLAVGGLGWADRLARAATRASGAASIAVGVGPIVAGLLFFGLLGLLTAVFELPFDLYHTFHIEERHGFNRQTLRVFLLDRLKGLAVAIALGGPMLALLLWIMGRMGPSWWIWAWAATSAFSVFAAWIYPTVLAPVFNEFTPLPEGELRESILALARRVGFRTNGLFVMDASRRTAHGNAYFTGLFAQKRIVLFDTLVETLAPREVVAVLAHELGHFKLHHVRQALLRSVLTTGALFFALHLCLPLTGFYSAFDLERTTWGALAVFGLWFGLIGFVLRPVGNAISRRHELAADTFALRAGIVAGELGEALLKLREKSRLLPLAHPLYSRVFHSHPPLLERLRAIGAVPAGDLSPRVEVRGTTSPRGGSG